MPPLPKDSSTRQRRNKTAGARVLHLVGDGERAKAPELPKITGRRWHAQTRAWWRDLWASPMAPEYDDSDRHGLYQLAVLVDDFWHEPDAKLAGEIRLQRQCFGLTPIDRRRLQWEIDRGEEATVRTAARREAPRPRPKKDPRALLA